MSEADVIVIGGGVTGAAVGLGLLEEGAERVVIFDEQLPSQRLSRGNFGLTWFMCKGANNPIYAQWCRMATKAWPAFAAQLMEETGYDIELEWTGGAVHAFGEEQFRQYAASVEAITRSCREVGLDYPVRMLNREEFAALIPEMPLGEEVSGAMYTAEQGHINPLLLLAALRSAFQKRGGTYKGAHSVSAISPKDDGSIAVATSRGTYHCKKLVVAAGHGSPRLLTPLGQKLPIYPQRGQLMVSERYQRVLKVPVLCTRQTPDGTFLIGLSTEDAALSSEVTIDAMKNQAANAIRLFPLLKKLNWTRSWGAIRVMTPDGAPIYTRLDRFENITVLALHSAVSLTPLHVKMIAPWILGTNEAPQISHFSNKRFNV
ncbi:NAD(P)/FAD-dependent oxidoreductase [Desulfogranum mediterraneum]|uniref:NAD(P)/FAD-dependent oxidoreductase n=1 Tax=Desulfogranum mediterraneum TaxID=160661 RepID=UPI000420A483|nr:FAD-binding oxidoreductase [Desulfogranum mediterraneum]